MVCPKCKDVNVCVPCGMLLDTAFEGARPEASQVMVFHAVLERLGMPPMEEAPLVEFINAVRTAHNGLET